jgi:ADP-heptose:LPS heptosyltransferase
MNVAAMRWLDRWVGTPVCLALTAVRKLADLGRRMIGTKPACGADAVGDAPRVLFVKLAEMGSTVLALPALARLQQLHPGVRLHYLCFAENRAVLDLIPEIPWEAVHTIRTGSPPAFVADVFGVLWRLRRLRMSVAVDLEIFSRASAILVYLSGARNRVGIHRFRAEGLNCGDLFTHRLTYNNHQHTSATFLSLIEALAAPADEVPLLKKHIEPPKQLPAFRPTDTERETVLARLREGGFPADGRGRIVILNVNASDLVPLRRWSADCFEDLGRRCLAEYADVWVVLTGSPGEAPAVEAFAGKLGDLRVISMAGRTSLRELLVLYTLSDVLITNDSGPAHFAALTPIHIISLFGPETPELYGPLSPRAHPITATLACSPCIHVFNYRNSPCTDNLCMQAITVDDVFAVLARILTPGLSF